MLGFNMQEADVRTAETQLSGSKLHSADLIRRVNDLEVILSKHGIGEAKTTNEGKTGELPKKDAKWVPFMMYFAYATLITCFAVPTIIFCHFVGYFMIEAPVEWSILIWLISFWTVVT